MDLHICTLSLYTSISIRKYVKLYLFTRYPYSASRIYPGESRTRSIFPRTVRKSQLLMIHLLYKYICIFKSLYICTYLYVYIFVCVCIYIWERAIHVPYSLKLCKRFNCNRFVTCICMYIY
jgi:hypothetical protein